MRLLRGIHISPRFQSLRSEEVVDCIHDSLQPNETLVSALTTVIRSNVKALTLSAAVCPCPNESKHAHFVLGRYQVTHIKTDCRNVPDMLCPSQKCSIECQRLFKHINGHICSKERQPVMTPYKCVL